MGPTQQTANRARYAATVRVNRRLCREHYLITLNVPGFAATEAGQFVQLSCGPWDFDDWQDVELDWPPGTRPAIEATELCEPLAFLRRPFSIARRRDRAGGGAELDFIYRVVGLGTSWLEQRKPGDAMDLIGPLGNRFNLPAGKSHGLLVGGGVGLPPMFYLAETLRAAGWSGCAFVGAMTRDLLPVEFRADPPADGSPSICVNDFAAHDLPAVVTTNDGSLGLKGLITDGLRGYLEQQPAADRARTHIYTCGPERMMEAVAHLAGQVGVSCEVCVEQAMACGLGTCQSCIVKVRGLKQGETPHGTLSDGTPWRYRLACTDGPVFAAEQVVW